MFLRNTPAVFSRSGPVCQLIWVPNSWLSSPGCGFVATICNVPFDYILILISLSLSSLSAIEYLYSVSSSPELVNHCEAGPFGSNSVGCIYSTYP